MRVDFICQGPGKTGTPIQSWGCILKIPNPIMTHFEQILKIRNPMKTHFEQILEIRNPKKTNFEQEGDLGVHCSEAILEVTVYEYWVNVVVVVSQ